MFRIIVPFYNAANYIGRCIESVKSQTLTTDWRCYLIDDCSTDGSSGMAALAVDSDPRFTLSRNKNRKGVCGNYAEIRQLAEIADDDIIVCLDGDDRLTVEALEVVSKVYNYEHETWATWGSYANVATLARDDVLHERGIACGPVTKLREVRRNRWRTSHLKTFRAFLLRAIKDADLRDAAGQYFQAAGDMAIMFPILEMADTHARFIRKVIYLYTADNPLSDHRVQLAAQKFNEQILRARHPYNRWKGRTCSRS